MDASGYFTDTLYTNNVLNFYNPAEQSEPAREPASSSLFFANAIFAKCICAGCAR